MPDTGFDPERVFEGLTASNVRFILIGGMAAILHGDAAVTMDVDIVPAYEPDNLDRLADALHRMDAHCHDCASCLIDRTALEHSVVDCLPRWLGPGFHGPFLRSAT